MSRAAVVPGHEPGGRAGRERAAQLVPLPEVAAQRGQPVHLVRLVGEMVPPNWGVLHSSIRAGILTFDTALLGTAAAFGISLLLTPFAARNISPSRGAYEVTRALIGHYVRHDEASPDPGFAPPWYSLDQRFVMEPGEAKRPVAPIRAKATAATQEGR